MASALEVFKAVFWSFFGVRKGRDLDSDLSRLRPLQVIVAGLAAAGLLVLALVSLAWFVSR